MIKKEVGYGMKQWNFYRTKHFNICVLGIGIKKDGDVLRRLFVFRYVFLMLGNYEYGLIWRSPLK